MTLDENLKVCRICTKRSMNAAVGLVCGLTLQKPTFLDQCSDFKIDQPEAQRLVQREQEIKQEAKEKNLDRLGWAIRILRFFLG